ncbi:hypothetical protein SASPL_125969 [Salvia splendens]|uniref:Transmembrane protein n=1 Tax=Salvia splendens TaxID=180675 RepID=A0A8X8ZQP0_SALSN|nr:hypothetical protein SASPL_125969 [Salvia splendens]
MEILLHYITLSIYQLHNCEREREKKEKMKSFAWILILLLLCTSNFITTFAHQDLDMLRSKDLLISSSEEEKFSFPIMEKVHDSGHARKLTTVEEITFTGKGQKGKGAYGGANVVHKRPGEKNASPTYRPCLFLFAAVVGFSFFS